MTKRNSDRKRPLRIDGHLQRWAEFRRSPRYPAAGISGAYRLEMPDFNRLPTSGQERWLLRHEREIRSAVAIERGFRRMTTRQRQLIFRRYFLHETWGEIARALKVTRSTVYRDRRTAFRLLSEEFGWEPEPSNVKLHQTAQGRR